MGKVISAAKESIGNFVCANPYIAIGGVIIVGIGYALYRYCSKTEKVSEAKV